MSYDEKEYSSSSFDFKTWKKIISMIVPYRGLILALLLLNIMNLNIFILKYIKIINLSIH